MNNQQTLDQADEDDATPDYIEPEGKWFYGVGRINKKEEK